MQFTRDLCLDLDAALRLHWLETDGCGGFAASTPLACPTSRYHGLLVAPSTEQPERHLYVSRCEETFHGDDQTFPISCASFGGTLQPNGHSFVDVSSFDDGPAFTYRIGHVVVKREIRMLRGKPVTLVRYTATGQRATIGMHLRPYLPCRRADSLSWENDQVNTTSESIPRGVIVQPYAALPRVCITFSRDVAYRHQPQWQKGIEYRDDVRRGYDGHEDQWSPGELRTSLESGEDVVVAYSIGEPVTDPAATWAEEDARRTDIALPEDPDVRASLDAAAEHYLYRGADGRPGIIAGFPWFGEWGRDTLIALPGLTLARGKTELCGEILSGLVPYLRDGRLPNVFGPAPDASDYKAVDSAMWFGRAVRLYADAGGDESRLLDELTPALLRIAEAHRGANRPELACDDGGIIYAGTPDVATTWMDAVIDGTPVTPRNGAQVEVNALWYVLVDLLAELLARKGDKHRATEWRAFRDRLGPAFIERFWIESRNRLADRFVDGETDDNVRPNAVIAASLPQSPLSKDQRKAVVDLARAELRTPVGLRTLSPRYLRYRGKFEGDQRKRDDAYHQGTVWPWLLGPYVEATLLAHGRSAKVKAGLRKLLDGFAPHLREHGIGQVSEVFDGDPPHRPGGCFAQAWSVAELLRAYSLLDARSTR